MTELLLKAGADVNAQGGQWGNALQAGIWRGNQATVKLLLREGADVTHMAGSGAMRCRPL